MKEMKERMRKSVEKRNGNAKKRRQQIVAFVLVFALAGLLAPGTVFASEGTGAITSSFENLKNIVVSIISGIGTIITLWGISEWGLSYQGTDGTMQAQAFKRIGGGLVMILAPQILTMLT